MLKFPYSLKTAAGAYGDKIKFPKCRCFSRSSIRQSKPAQWEASFSPTIHCILCNALPKVKPSVTSDTC